VARRASVAQGQALVTVWERSIRENYFGRGSEKDGRHSEATQALKVFNTTFQKINKTKAPNAHLAPLWGLVTRAMDVSLQDAAYLFLFSHARTVVSAAVRANVLGPYQAQGVLANSELQIRIRELVEEGWERSTEDAGQCVPVMDLWVGRHEKLYSRIFNS